MKMGWRVLGGGRAQGLRVLGWKGTKEGKRLKEWAEEQEQNMLEKNATIKPNSLCVD